MSTKTKKDTVKESTSAKTKPQQTSQTKVEIQEEVTGNDLAHEVIMNLFR